MATKISDSSELTIPIKNLVSIIIVAAVAVWLYNTQIASRIDSLEHKLISLQLDHTKMESDHDDRPRGHAVELGLKRIQALELQIAALTERCEIKQERLNVLESQQGSQLLHGNGNRRVIADQ